MSTIFISYASKNRDFAQKLVADLERFYDVWIDHGELSGGLEWERRIQQAITDCKIFVVIISTESNDSDWVARETILAEKKQKPRIPVLLNDELPFRLLNLHYVDFRGEYAGGFRDLLTALKKHIQPDKSQDDHAKTLLAEGILAYLQDDHSQSQSLIGQAIVLMPDLADSVQDFWQRLREEQATHYARDLIGEIVIRESANLVRENVKSSQAGGAVDVYAWRIRINNDDNVLNKIDYVEYKLHETFPNPLQIVRSRQNKFLLRGSAWGGFDVRVRVFFTDGTIGTGTYTILRENRADLLHDISVD